MKKEYEAPELEITVFEPEDIVASLINGGGNDDDGWGPIG